MPSNVSFWMVLIWFFSNRLQREISGRVSLVEQELKSASLVFSGIRVAQSYLFIALEIIVYELHGGRLTRGRSCLHFAST